VLSGPPAAGKNTVAALIADEWGLSVHLRANYRFDRHDQQDSQTVQQLAPTSRFNRWSSRALTGSIPRKSLAHGAVGRLATCRWEYIR